MNTELNTVRVLIQKFHSLQEERVYTYKLFDEGHKIYLSSAPNYDFVKFRQLVHDVTQEFKRISSDIIEIEKQLRSSHPALADVIVKLQEEEKLKLEMSAKLQLASQETLENPEVVNKQITLKNSLKNVINRINSCLEDMRFEMDALESI